MRVFVCLRWLESVLCAHVFILFCDLYYVYRRVKLADGSLVNLRDFVTDDSSSQLLVVTGGDVDSVAQLTGWELAAHWDSDGDAEPSATRATAASAFVPPEAVVFHEADVLGEGDSVQGDDDDDTVTFDERLVFATALESAWLHQQDSQLRALLSGIAQVDRCK